MTAIGIGEKETTVATAGATGIMIAAMMVQLAPAGMVATMTETASGAEESTAAGWRDWDCDRRDRGYERGRPDEDYRL